jgi:DNA-binding MarR family transcriptional regulator
LIRREADPSDGRSTLVTLTREGKRRVEQVLQEHARNEERLAGGLSDSDRKQLTALLEALAISLGDAAPRPTRDRGTPRPVQ